MTFTPQVYGEVSIGNSFEISNANTNEYNVVSGTTISATSDTVVLSDGSANDNEYNGLAIEFNYISSSTTCIITNYVGSTKTATLTCDHNIPPNGTNFVIHQNSGICQVQQIPTIRTHLKLSTNSSSVDDFYKGTIIKILYGAGYNQIRRIKSYDGTNRIILLEQEWDILPDDTSVYAIYGESGLATFGTSSSIQLDGFQSSIVGRENLICEIIEGTGLGQTRQVVVLDNNIMTISPDWNIVPDTTSRYVIYGGYTGIYESVLTYSMMSCILRLDTQKGDRATVEFKMAMSENGENHNTKLTEVDIISKSSPHVLTIISEYFRVSVVSMGTFLTGEIQTTYNAQKSSKLTSSVSSQIVDSQDCDIVRSIITGKTKGGQYVNTSVDSTGNIHTRITNPLTRFGDIKMSKLTPVSQISFIYGLSDFDTETFRNPGTWVTTQVDGAVDAKASYHLFLPIGSAFNSSGVGNYFTLENGTSSSFYVWFNVSSGNSDPLLGGTGIEVSITSSYTSLQITTATKNAMTTDFSAVQLIGNLLQITNLVNGECRSIEIHNMPSESGSIISSAPNSSLAKISTGTGIGDFVVLRSRRAIKYRPAFGCECRFSVIFGSPVAGTSMYTGIGNSTGGLFVGYTGTDFQIIRRNGGIHKICELKITSVAGASAGIITLWIDGLNYDINITDVSSVQAVSTTISTQDYEPIMYKVECIDDIVQFVSTLIIGGTGNNKFEFDGGSTGITGIFTSISEANNTTNYITQQSSWNIDRLDGHGASGMILDPQKGNIFSISYQAFGFGSAVFSIENSMTGEFIPFHHMIYTNRHTTVNLVQPSMQLTSFVSSTYSTTPAEMWLAGAAGFVEGEITRFDPVISVSNTHDNQSGSNSNRVLMAIRTPLTFRGVISQVQLFIQSFTTSSSKSATDVRSTISYRLVLGGTPSEALNYNYVDPTNSAVIVAKPINATLAGGQTLFITSVVSEGSNTNNLKDMNIIIQKHNNLYITYSHNTPTNNGDVDVSADLVWIEDS